MNVQKSKNYKMCCSDSLRVLIVSVQDPQCKNHSIFSELAKSILLLALVEPVHPVLKLLPRRKNLLPQDVSKCQYGQRPLMPLTLESSQTEILVKMASYFPER